jgi:cupin superfamily acireductone dioxygenase involved in methionine salvage
MKLKNIVPFFVVLMLFACSKSSKTDKKALARVNSSYLYSSDVEGMGSGLSKEDSATQVSLYIEKWAVDQLMLEMANSKLNQKESEKIDRMVENYRNSLLVAAFEEESVRKELDTLVSSEQITAYYKMNRDQYISGKEMIRCHFVRVKRSLPDIDKLRNWFKSDDKKDFEKVKEYCLSKQGINFVLDSDEWINPEKIAEMLPEKSLDLSTVKTDRSYDRTEDDYLYLFRVFEIRERNSPIPMSQVKDEIAKIILQQRSNEILQKIRSKAAEKVKSGKVFEKF